MSHFTGRMISAGKRMNRYKAWTSIALRLTSGGDGGLVDEDSGMFTVAMLAGGAPSGELRCIDSVFEKCARVIACDYEESNVDAALKSGAWRGFVGDMKDIPMRVDAAHLDFCGPLTPARLAVAADVAKASRVLAVTFSYGRDDAPLFELRSHEVNPFWLWACYGDARLLGRVASLRTAITNRIPRMGEMTYLCRYPGHRMPMCTVVWSRKCEWTTDPNNLHVEDLKGYNARAFRDDILEMLDMGLSRDELSARYDVSPATLTAWKAVRTARVRRGTHVLSDFVRRRLNAEKLVEAVGR